MDVLRRNLRAALKGGAGAAALELLAQLKEEEPLAVETRTLELEVLLKAQRHDEAERLAGQLLRLYPDNGWVQFLAGMSAYRRRDYVTAATRFQESLRLSPHWRTRCYLGRALTQGGRLDQAEPLLLALVAERPQCRRDLAWLLERRGDGARALAEVTRYLADYPDDPLAREQEQRLRARSLAPGELQAEVETLVELGEEVPPELLPEYVESLFASGRGEQARAFVAERAAHLEPRLAVRVAWSCHHHEAFDLAYSLFLRDFRAQCGNVKFLAALEKCAGRCDRLGELIAFYEEQAPQEKRLYGRARKLRKRLDGVADEEGDYDVDL